MRILGFALFIHLILAGAAHGRVFNINQESFAAYVGGTMGSGFQNTLMSESSTRAGTNITLNDRHAYNSSGEFGFVYASPGANIKFGVEVIKPKDLADEVGSDDASTELYSYNSEISALIPKVALELNFKKWQSSRIFLGLGVGSANLIARNSYTFTAAGTTAFGIDDFYEDLRATSTMYEGGLGFESLLTDTTTFVLHGGYRSLVFDEIKHNRDITTFQGAAVRGDKAVDRLGNDRSLNLTNTYVGLAIRIWIH